MVITDHCLLILWGIDCYSRFVTSIRTFPGLLLLVYSCFVTQQVLSFALEAQQLLSKHSKIYALQEVMLCKAHYTYVDNLSLQYWNFHMNFCQLSV